jgi:desulfoferrodoxin (superoxide reductase-like protein)
MNRKNLIYFALIYIAIFGLYTINVNADVPRVTSLELDEETDTLSIGIRHGNPSSSHYIDEIEVEVNGEVETIELEEAQSSTTFTETYEVLVDIENLRSRVHCNVHGWSSWSQLELDEPEDGGRSIPGVPVSAILAALILVTLSLSRNR